MTGVTTMGTVRTSYIVLLEYMSSPEGLILHLYSKKEASLYAVFVHTWIQKALFLTSCVRLLAPSMYVRLRALRLNFFPVPNYVRQQHARRLEKNVNIVRVFVAQPRLVCAAPPFFP